MSVFFHNHKYSLSLLLTELSSLSGVGVTGKPLTNRIKGEEYVLTHNATVLCISGICGNETETFNTSEGSSNNYNADNTEINELMSKVLGNPRCVKTFIDRGYFRNGLKNINLIHVEKRARIAYPWPE